MIATYEQLRAILQAKGYRFFDTGKYNLNIIGVRSMESRSNAFDDYLFVAYRDKMLQPRVNSYNITTDPGKPWLLKPMDPLGTAVIVPGQYLDAYTIGIHGRSKPANRQYEALEQVGSMRYVRDNSKDDLIDTRLWLDPKNVFTGILKTNIHRCSKWSIQKLVETYSAGCQVHADPKKFEEFMALCRTSRDILKVNRFTYTLLMESDFK